MALAYMALLVVLTMPVLLTAFPDQLRRNNQQLPWELFVSVPYVFFVAVVGLSQFLLIRVPVRLKLNRKVARRGLWLPIVATGFWMGCLMLGAYWSVTEFRNPNYELGERPVLWIGLPLLMWIVWTAVFWRMSGLMEPGALVERQTRWMLRGSILELLIAVPTHVVTRGRPECCAGFGTFFGITMGLSVMLLSFGPAVFVLFYARWRRLQG